MKKWEIDRIKRAIQSCKNKIKHHHEHTRSKVSNAIKNEYAKIDALEKQIPKKVNIQRYIYTKCDCGYEFSKHYGDGYYDVPQEKKTNYCPECGQALDWSDTV